MNHSSIKQTARQRVQLLFIEAQKIGQTDAKLAMKYIKMARKIAMAGKIRLPIDFRRQTCKNCNALFFVDSNCRVRVKKKREPHVLVTCLNCGNQTRRIIRKLKGEETA